MKLSERVFRIFEFIEKDKIKNDITLILLSESRHVIWLCRNLANYEGKPMTAFAMLEKFINRIKIRLLTDHDRMNSGYFEEIWCRYNFCKIDEHSNQLVFDASLETS